MFVALDTAHEDLTMSSSRDAILAKIREAKLPEATLPDLQGNWLTFADPEKQFIDVLTSVGGQASIAPTYADVPAIVRGLPCFAEAQQIFSLVPEVGLGNFDANAVATPHDLNDLDLAILPGAFAVAENGAVWTTDAGLKHRVVSFITQHLVLVVPRGQMVQNMHEAYERIQFAGAGYGLFISGPSKTADIEQSLVIGAHGPRSLHVILVG